MQNRTRCSKLAVLLTSFLLAATATTQNPFQGFPPPAPAAPPEITAPPAAPGAPALPTPTGLNTSVLTPTEPAPLPEAPIPELEPLSTNRYILKLPVALPVPPSVLPHAARYAHDRLQEPFLPDTQQLFTLLAITHANPSVAAIRAAETNQVLVVKAGDTLPGDAVVTSITAQGVTISNANGEATLTLTRSHNE